MDDPPKPPALERLTEARFRALAHHSRDIVSLLDAQGRLLFNSSAAERISGFSLEELTGVDTFTFIHPDDRDAVRSGFTRVLTVAGASMTVQYRYKHKSGGWTWMEATASNHLDDPEVRGVVATSRDITDRKRAEEEREDLLVALQEALANVKALTGLLPMCAWCKSVRDDRGYWERIDRYVTTHTAASITHALCPTCAAEKFPEGEQEQEQE